MSLLLLWTYSAEGFVVSLVDFEQLNTQLEFDIVVVEIFKNNYRDIFWIVTPVFLITLKVFCIEVFKRSLL